MRAAKFLLDLIFITRPIILVPVWGFALFGYRISTQTNDFFQMISFQTIAQIFLFSLSVAAVYVLNQVADRKVDEANEGFPLLLKAGVSNKTAWIWTIILALLSITIPFFCGFPKISVLSAFSLGIGVLYCFKPFSFSGRPILDFLSNALGYGTVAFAVGWILGGATVASHFDFLQAMLPYFFMMAGGSISSTLPDYDGDKANGKITTAVFFGKRTAHFIAMGCIILSVALAFNAGDFVALSASSVALVFYVLHAFAPQNQKLMEMCYKVGGGISMLIIGAFFPILLIVGGLVFVATVAYFRVFYNVAYPSLLPAEATV